MSREENIVVGYLWRCIECGYSRKNKVRVANHILKQSILIVKALTVICVANFVQLVMLSDPYFSKSSIIDFSNKLHK